jgi:DNA helicase MCM9
MAEILLTLDPKSVSPKEYREQFRQFLEEFEFEQVESLLLIDCPSEQHHSFVLHFDDLVQFDSALSHIVLYHPRLILPIIEESLMELQFALYQHPSFEEKWGRRAQVKSHCHVRLVSIPSISELSKPTIGTIRSQEVSSLIQICGTVVRTGAVRMLEVSKQYECQNPKCRYRFTVTADPEQDHMLPQPRTCPSKADGNITSFQGGRGGGRGGAGRGGRGRGRGGGNDSGGDGGGDSSGITKCNSSNLREIEGSRVCADYQEIKVQDPIERLPLGSVPRSIVVILQADLVDKYNAGDDIVIVGTIVRRWRPVVRGVRCMVDVAINANSVVAHHAVEQIVSLSDATASQFEVFWRQHSHSSRAIFAARNMIIRSVCPQLYGMFLVKLALLLSLVGGTNPALAGSSTRDHGDGGDIGGVGGVVPSAGGRGVITDLTNEEEEEAGGSGNMADGGGGRGGVGGGVGQIASREAAERGIHRRTHIHMLMVCFWLTFGAF